MAQGIFTLKQVVQGIQQNAWPNPGSSNTFGAYFRGSGSGDYLTGPTTGTLNFSTGSFTVEYFIFLNSFGGGGLSIAFSASNAGADFQLNVNDSTGVTWHNSGNQLTSPNTSKPLGKWVHIALVRSGTTASLFCNGVRSSTTTNSAAVNLTNFYIGSYAASPSAYMVEGWISNLRITNTAVYDPTATSLTLPTSPLTAISGTQLLTLQSATIIDNSTNALTITKNGLVGMHTVAPFGLSTRTTPEVEYLVVAGGGAGGNGLGGSGSGGGGGGGGVLADVLPVTAGTSYRVTVGAGGSAGTTNSGSAGPSGSNSVFGPITALGGGGGGGSQSTLGVTLGVSGGSGGGAGRAGTGTNGGQGTFGQGNAGGRSKMEASYYGTGGGGGAGTPGLDGKAFGGGFGGAGIASVIRGSVAIYAGGGGGSSYSGSGTIPGGAGGGGAGSTNTATVGGAGTVNTGGGGGAGACTASQNDSGAGAGGSGIVVLSYPDTYAPASATSGTPTATTSGSGSVSFTGSGSAGAHLSYPHSSALQFGSGAFTIECWGLFRGTHEHAILARAPFDGTNNEWIFSIGATLYPTFNYSPTGSNSTNALAGSTAVALNTWYHIAVVRNSNTLTMYLNGTSVGTASITGSIYSSGTCTTTFGSYAHIGVSTNGYAVGNCLLSNVRAVKGTAVYTSNFTPSTIPLTAISGTGFLNNTVSGSHTTDSSTNTFKPSAPSSSGIPPWDAGSPFTVTGYKNRVYSFTSSGTITF